MFEAEAAMAFPHALAKCHANTRIMWSSDSSVTAERCVVGSALQIKTNSR
jgi:hypothetical protein